MKTKPVRWILVHPGFHFDEGLAVYLLRRFGECLFPGISTAHIVFKLANIDGITTEQQRWSADQLLSELGVLCVGCLGDRGALFDEHGEQREKNQAACMLVWRFLVDHAAIKKEDGRALDKILGFVDQFDRQGHGEERKLLESLGKHSAALTDFDVRAALRVMHENVPDEHCMHWLLLVIDRFVERQYRIQSLRQRVDRLIIAQAMVMTSRDTPIKVAFVEADEADVPHAVFRRGFRIVIVRKSNGEVVIINSGKLQMERVVAALRQIEADRRGWMVDANDDLQGERSSVSNWHFQPNTGNIFNTSIQRVDHVEPTVLSREELLNVVSQYV